MSDIIKMIVASRIINEVSGTSSHQSTPVPTHSSKAQHTCSVCGMSFKKTFNLKKHEEIHKGLKPFKCPTCGKSFSRKFNMKVHIVRVHPKNQVGTGESPTNFPAINMGGFIRTESVAKCRLQTYKITPEGETANCLPTFLNGVKDPAIRILQQNLAEHPSIKINVFSECIFKKAKREDPDSYDYCTNNLKTKNEVIYRGTNLDEFCDTMFRKLISEKTECELYGSGWTFSHVLWLELRVNKFSPLSF